MCKKYAYFFLVTLFFVNVKYIFGDENLNGTKENKTNNKTLVFSFVNKRQQVPHVSWPLGIVYYYLDHKSYDYLIARRVRTVMNMLEDVSCLRFKALTEPYHDAPWISISNPDKIRECVHTDYNNTALEINMIVGYECLQRWEILHSLMHAIGFKDEVTHPQRDQYVRIMWENIHPKYQSLFRIRYDDFSPVKTEYDSISIMHFHDRAFSKNGQATVAPLIPGLMIDPSEELSPLDKMRLRLIFGHECNKRKVSDLLDSCKSVMHNETSPNQLHGDDYINIGDESYERISSGQENDNNIGKGEKENANVSTEDFVPHGTDNGSDGKSIEGKETNENKKNHSNYEDGSENMRWNEDR